MIVYNMRYRGSIEYDKMILNALSFYNEVYSICEDEYLNGEFGSTIKDYTDRCDALINHYQSLNSPALLYIKKNLESFSGGLYD